MVNYKTRRVLLLCITISLSHAPVPCTVADLKQIYYLLQSFAGIGTAGKAKADIPLADKHGVCR